MSGRSSGGGVVRIERRRRWSDEEKLAILKETTQPGAIVALVARRYGIETGQLYTWHKQLLRGAMAGFVPVEVMSAEPTQERKRCFPPTLCDVVTRSDVGRYGSPQPYERTGHPHWSWSGACSPP